MKELFIQFYYMHQLCICDIQLHILKYVNVTKCSIILAENYFQILKYSKHSLKDYINSPIIMFCIF